MPQPLVPARPAYQEGTPYSEAFGDVYHSAAGALAQADHVFLRGNQLPDRWRGRETFVILETGFGFGINFLTTWQAWGREPPRWPRLPFLSVGKPPLFPHGLPELPQGQSQLKGESAGIPFILA